MTKDYYWDWWEGNDYLGGDDDGDGLTDCPGCGAVDVRRGSLCRECRTQRDLDNGYGDVPGEADDA